MENPDQRAAVLSKVLRKYRKVVRILRVLPFAYLCLYAIVLMTSGLMSERIACIIDCSLFVSPAVSAGLLLLSGALGMCDWHKAACLIPYSSRVVSFIDTNILTFTQDEVVLINGIIAISVAVFAALAFKHLLCTTSPRI